MGFEDQRFNVNLSILFTELPLLERPAAAAAAGFTAVELWWPWVDSPTPERSELDALKKAVEDAGVRLTGLNFYAGRLPGPDRGALSLPGEESERFRANIDVAADFAQSLGCGALNALYGNRVDGTMLRKSAADSAPRAGPASSMNISSEHSGRYTEPS
ncbi:TIM barrel protein, partial [Streptomyces sp. NPDC005486]|uniref:TIM barrel protein n=1 Tax=Streptomyces sp. NPDC005486 TaxID=3155345 RepID=UPI0033A7337C